MDEKRRDAGTLAPAIGDSPSSADPPALRRRAGGQKRKSGSLGSLGSSSAPSKRVTREKAMLAQTPIHSHNGPQTRARQAPSSLAAISSAAPAAELLVAGEKHAKVGDAAAAAEELRKESELVELEAELEARFELVRSRSATAHVVPSHCGWFSWTNIHLVEEQTLPSFFDGKSELRTPKTYLEIRNWIMRKFHANPSVEIELKDLSELAAADSDARQEVLEFLDFWGLINFHPFPQTGSEKENADGDCPVSLVDKLYHFETPQSSKPVVSKNSVTAVAAPSGLFPESVIAEELVRTEGPGVEYHCNSCSADCSRKRYHCQKQADFDLCSECFTNKKFDSGMSSSDFILMEPGEIPGLSGGKWTDQETLLLLEALELYKENWSEIAEHVATKTKAQCILHFVQMPIEDSFLDLEDDDADLKSKETANPASSEKDQSAAKDTAEATECDTVANESKSPTSQTETPKEETAKPDASQETSKTEEKNEDKTSRDCEDRGMVALKEAFEAVGYPLTPERPLSFARVGNPVMTLAAFLANLVGADLGTVSAHNSLKSLSGKSPGMELATRHCFLMEDPPNDDNKELAELYSVAEVADGETNKEEVKEHQIEKDDSSIENHNKKSQDSAIEEKKSLGLPDAKSPEKIDDAKAAEPTKLDKSGGIVNDDLKTEPEIPESTVKETKENSGKPPEAIDAVKDVEMSEARPSENSEARLSEPTASIHVDTASNPSIKEDNQVAENVNAGAETPSKAARDVEMAPQLSERNETSQPVSASTAIENREKKRDTKETKEESNYDKIKRAAISAISATAVKAKLLADQEEEQIRQLSTLLIEKQLQKLEFKLGFFNDMENVILRVRDQVERSRQRLYHERANIIAARLGLPASSSRMMSSPMPGQRPGMNVAGSSPRPPLGMMAQRPQMSRPIGPPNPLLPSSTSAGSSLQPPSQEQLSSMGAK